MGFLRHNRRAALLIGAGLVVALVAVVLMVHGSDPPKKGKDNSAVGTAPAATPGSSVPLPKTGRKKAHHPRRTAAAGAPAPVGAPAGALGSVKGLAGFGGRGWTADAPRHTITLTVTAPQSARTAVGWWVPTSPGAKTGSAKYIGASWSHTVYAYGSPDYARLLAIAGIEGVPTTCTIRVDGRVVDQRTTEHAYGQALCQG
jgi:hypothetical protein